MKKTKDQIERFLNLKCFCCYCKEFQDELRYSYALGGVYTAQVFIGSYKGAICGTLDGFLYPENE